MSQAEFSKGKVARSIERTINPAMKSGMPHQRSQPFSERTAKRVKNKSRTNGRIGLNSIIRRSMFKRAMGFFGNPKRMLRAGGTSP